MTRARALKTIIRARAAKTGERYTAARRHVLEQLDSRTLKTRAAVAPQAPVAPVEPQAAVAPVAPRAPVAPVAPRAPVAPVAPRAPVALVAPRAPVAPVAPRAPVALVAPRAPVAPAAPFAPAPSAPDAPLAPLAPTGPRSGLSDAKAREKTGHGFDHWFAVLDRFGGPGRGHTALARHLYADHGVPGWHSQGITVAYERARGVRDVNQRCDGEYEVSVSKTVNGTTAGVVKAIADARRRNRWTAEADSNLVKALVAGVNGAGSKGIVVRPDGLGRFRYKWGATVVQMYLAPKPGGKVAVTATNSKLANAGMVEARRALWRTALDALARDLDPRRRSR